jgi:hypothetical protein
MATLARISSPLEPLRKEKGGERVFVAGVAYASEN